MSISSQITRLQNAKSSLKTAINSKLASNPITDETIEDFAEKVNDIVVPSGEIIEGSLSNSVSEGKNLSKRNFIYASTSAYKLNSNYLVDFGTTEIKLLKYNNNKIETIDSLNQSTTKRFQPYYCEENGNYYFLVSTNSTDLAIIGTDLEEIWISSANEGVNAIKFTNSIYSFFQQTDYNKFVNYNIDKTNKKIEAVAISVDFVEEEIKTSSVETILSTTDTWVDIDYTYSTNFGIMGGNRFYFAILVRKNNTSTLNIKLCKVNDGTWNPNSSNIITLCSNNSISYTDSSGLFPKEPKIVAGYKGEGIIDIRLSSFSTSEDFGYISSTDSQMTFNSGSCINTNKSYYYGFSLNQVIKETRNNNAYTYELCSINKYTYTPIKDITNDNAIKSSPKEYKDTTEKTSDNLIVCCLGGIKVYEDYYSQDTLRYYYNSDTNGNYISAESGDAGEIIKIYSPST